jgi:hypothetical protein
MTIKTRLNASAEAVRQKYLRYGGEIANEAEKAWLKGGHKGLKEFDNKLKK